MSPQGNAFERSGRPVDQMNSRGVLVDFRPIGHDETVFARGSRISVPRVRAQR
jgi:hypothetical protein